MTRRMNLATETGGPVLTRRRVIVAVLATVMTLVVAIAAAVVLDYRAFDQTTGGYAPPYTDWSGTPIDWDATERTDDGFRQPGRVVSSHLNCTTGMITFEALGLRIDFREVSERAIAVHHPRAACVQAGFEPQF